MGGFHKHPYRRAVRRGINLISILKIPRNQRVVVPVAQIGVAVVGQQFVDHCLHQRLAVGRQTTDSQIRQEVPAVDTCIRVISVPDVTFAVVWVPNHCVARHVLVVAHNQNVRGAGSRAVGRRNVVEDVGIRAAHFAHRGHVRLIPLHLLPLGQRLHFVDEAVSRDNQVVGFGRGGRQVRLRSYRRAGDWAGIDEIQRERHFRRHAQVARDRIVLKRRKPDEHKAGPSGNARLADRQDARVRDDGAAVVVRIIGELDRGH